MAKKIRKAPPQRKSMLVLFFEVLTPWLVMGLSATLLVEAGVSGLAVVVIALGAALGTTVLIKLYNNRRARLAQTSRTSTRRR
jgi:hypothetical protein